MSPITRSVWLVLTLAAPTLHAEPWLCSLPDGRKEFSYEPASARNRNCVDHPISRGYVRAHPSRMKQRQFDSPGHFPQVDAKTQKRRDNERLTILQRELAEERRALAEAVRELTQLKQTGVAASAPTMLRQYEQRIRTHQTNIATLEKELRIAG